MKSWTVQAEDGIQHTIQYKKGVFSNKVIVDNESYKVKSSNWCINLIDYSINFGTTNCHLVVTGNKADLAVNGTYLDSQKEYEPLSKVPEWIYILIGISVFGGMIVSGILSLVIGIIMSTFYVQAALKKKTGTVIGLFAACTAIQLAYTILLLFVFR